MAEERLIDTSELPLERELLRAAAEESPPPSARRRGLAALGLLSVAVPTWLCRPHPRQASARLGLDRARGCPGSPRGLVAGAARVRRSAHALEVPQAAPRARIARHL